MLDQGEQEGRDSFLERIDVQKTQVRVGYNRVMEKVKELRQGFSNAVTAGSRSGSGKLVLEFYDLMVQIWGGAPSTEPLPFGIQSSQAASISSIDGNDVAHVSSEEETEETLEEALEEPNQKKMTLRRKRMNKMDILLIRLEVGLWMNPNCQMLLKESAQVAKVKLLV